MNQQNQPLILRNSNHNETVVNDNEEAAVDTAPLPDLAVSEEQAEQTKGGLLLPAVQKVREAAARS